MKGRRIVWNETLDGFIVENYHRMTRGEIARKLGVSPRSVTYRARQLGISGRTYREMLEDDDFRGAVSKVISDGVKRNGKDYSRYLLDHPDTGSEHRFRKGYSASRRAQDKATAARKRMIYDELVRMKYGLPRKTRLKLNKRMNIDKDKYIKQQGK